MGRYASLLGATGGELDRGTRLGKWFEAVSRSRDDLTARNRRALSILKSTGGQLSLSTPTGNAALRMSVASINILSEVFGEKSAIEGNRRPTARWFLGNSPAGIA